MGLVVSNLKYRDLLNDVSFKIGKSRILGIYGNNAKYILDILNGDLKDYTGIVEYEKYVVDELFYKNNSSVFFLVNSNPVFYTNKVEEEFKFNLTLRKYNGDFDKAIIKGLSLLGFDKEILNRKINTLSRSEKYLLSIAIGMSFNPEVIMFKDTYVGMDHNNKKLLTTLVNNLKEDKKIVILASNDTNLLYQYTDEVILLDGNNIYKVGQTDKIFTSVELMKGDIIPMPNITKVTYLAKSKKNVKLSYHKDVRDIIKDIYKHV
ncbi:MAG: ATP-binding cassette domain-containing protein [Bacilli bacterium]|nr:ATP-binding cassette domain-containing protein [Bacilli bacterium]